MKMPKNVQRYCPFCKKHTDHTISVNKKKNPSSLTYGSKVRARRRGRARGKGNLGRYSKKTDLRYQCKVCKKMHVQRQGFRAKKLEFK